MVVKVNEIRMSARPSSTSFISLSSFMAVPLFVFHRQHQGKDRWHNLICPSIFDTMSSPSPISFILLGHEPGDKYKWIGLQTGYLKPTDNLSSLKPLIKTTLRSSDLSAECCVKFHLVSSPFPNTRLFCFLKLLGG